MKVRHCKQVSLFDSQFSPFFCPAQFRLHQWTSYVNPSENVREAQLPECPSRCMANQPLCVLSQTTLALHGIAHSELGTLSLQTNPTTSSGKYTSSPLQHPADSCSSSQFRQSRSHWLPFPFPASCLLCGVQPHVKVCSSSNWGGGDLLTVQHWYAGDQQETWPCTQADRHQLRSFSSTQK